VSGDLVSLALADGATRWERQVGAAPTAGPASMDGHVFVGFADGRVIAFAPETGSPQWTRPLGSKVLVLSATATRVVAGAENNFLYVLDPKDGDQKWKWRTGGDLLGDAVTDGHRLYYVSLDNTLRAHNQRNGHLAWKRSLSSRPVGGPLWIGDRVVVAAVAPELRAFTAANGTASGVVSVPGRIIHRPYLVEAAGDLPPLLVIVTAGGQVQAIGQTIEPPLVPLESLPGNRLIPETLKR
jgi:outer membrane protein assembly factor BamB